MHSLLYLTVVSVLLSISPIYVGISLAQGNRPQDHMALYLDLMTSLQPLSLEQQAQTLETFLREFPDTPYKNEIETNRTTIEQLLLATDPQKKKEQRDTELYFKATGLAQTLAAPDQINLWQQFLAENPDTIYRSEIMARMGELQSMQKRPPQQTPAMTSADSSPSRIPIVRQLPYKDAQQAFLLSTFAGLAVPGIAHWYTGDVLIASMLTAVRIVGLAIGIPAIINYNTPMIVTGGLLAGFSYIADIIDAPYTVERYNRALDQGNRQAQLLTDVDTGLRSQLSLGYRFQF